MKDWWINLPLRDKQLLLLGGLVVFLFLLYEMVWSPLASANDSLRVRILKGEETLTSMQNADQLIQHLITSSQKKTRQQGQSSLGILQGEINKSKFASHVTQLRQTENESVQVNMTKVNFDELLVFLNMLWKKYDVIVSQISVVPTGVAGEVNVDIILV
jgi:type II secretory pathway component PulM